MAKINDLQEFKQWLEGKPRDWRTAIASRTAMRVLPVVGSDLTTVKSLHSWRNVVVLPLFRAQLISAVAAVYPTVETKATFAATDAAFAAAAAAGSAASASSSAASAAASAAFNGVTYAADAAFAASASASVAFVDTSDQQAAYAGDAAFVSSSALASSFSSSVNAFWKAIESDVNWL